VSLLQNLRAAFRLAATGRGAASDFVFSVDQVVLLAIATVVFAAAGSFVGSVAPRDFYLPAIESLSFRWVLTLVFAYLATRFFSPPPFTTPLDSSPTTSFATPPATRSEMTPLVVVLFGLAAVERVVVSLLDLCEIHVPRLAEEPYATTLDVGLWGWLFWVTFRAVRLTSTLPPSRVAAIVGLYLAGLWSVLSAVPLEPFFVTDTWTEVASQAPDIDAESVLYDQPDQVDRALAALAPERPGVTDLYFVAFAGDASQAVFRREVSWVRRLFDRRFATRGRSISLINSPESLDRSPLASSTNLAAVVSGIGQRMDTERDVLFLFLTSHGSPTPELAVEFAPIPLRQISPEALRSMLDEAGIRWRVIVISACFSGGFIETLENPETLVITASAADRESFGCSHEADFTYFGRAYFEQELTRTHSFEAAFEAARESIAELEASEGKPPSLPQMVVGDRIRVHLRELERTLDPH